MSIRLRRTDGPIPTRPVSDDYLYRRCRDGLEPAEALTRVARAVLVHELWALGWTDVEVAVHTRLTTYTAAAIRTRLGLPCRPKGAAA
jgi:hypothetical protein